jgi:hypothetical protein
MTIVDTPGTNVILQRQQRLTEEFVPRADLLLFVISADRPLTGSEVWLRRERTKLNEWLRLPLERKHEGNNWRGSKSIILYSLVYFCIV